MADQPRPGMGTPCLDWTASCNPDGYGRFRLDGETWRSHRVAWELENGSIPDGMHVLHHCDNPACVRVDHLFLGTNDDNVKDKMAKGRYVASRGDRNGSRLHPERRARGDRNGSHTHPECVPRGDRNGSRMHPERLARGDRNGSHTHPERVPRGDSHGSHLHPESRPRGEQHARAKLTEENVRSIFERRSHGWTQTRIADEFGVGQAHIARVLAGKNWAHVVTP